MCDHIIYDSIALASQINEVYDSAFSEKKILATSSFKHQEKIKCLSLIDFAT